jgi:hypothetical protein
MKLLSSIKYRIASGKFPRWLDVIWLLLLAAYILAGTALVPFHGDESTHIFMGRDFHYGFVEREIYQLTYRDWDTLDGQAATRQDLRLKDGVLARYLFGAAAYLGGYGIDEINQQWAWGAGWDWNHQNGHVPDDRLLLWARYASATLLAFGVIVLFAIGIAVGGRTTAYIATLLYAANPALLLNGRRAMLESAMTLFSLLVVLAGLYVVQSRKWWAYALLGLFSGLAVASKHTSVVTVAAVFLTCGIVLVYRIFYGKSPSLTDGIYPVPTKQFVYLVVAGILSLTVYYVLNPAWWSNPIARTSEVSETRLSFMQAQQETFGSYESFADRVHGFYWQTFAMQNMYAETTVDNFVENLANEIAVYEASLLSGFITQSPIVPFIFAALSIIGAIALYFDKQMPTENRFIVGMWIAAMILLTLFLTPLEWQRYYLPAYPAVMLLTGLGICFIINHIRYLKF